MNYEAINTRIYKDSMEFNEAKTEVSFQVVTTPNVVGNTYEDFLKEEFCEGLCMVTVSNIATIETAAQTFATTFINTKYPNT